MFTPNKSSSWDQLGYFGINGDGVGLEANLGYSQAAQFGLDTLGVGLLNGSNGFTLGNQTIGGIATTSPFYLGTLGLSTQPLNFSTLGNFSSPSLVTSLKDLDKIPSLSWSYTAGAMYRLKKVYGQLIFSGYDTSRFEANDVSFSMADDVTRDIVVGLQAITYSGTQQSSLLASPINLFIDSTDPNLWLPDDTISAFETAFGLILDNKTGLYLVNDSHHASLLASDAEVSFRLSDVLEGGATTTVVLPYAAFGLQAQYPLVENTSYYFPLKRAANESQYTLGRTFLQEAYLTVDYERRVFNVSQCTWVEGDSQNIVTISSKDGGSAASNSSSSVTTTSGPVQSQAPPSLSAGAIAGIVIGLLVVLALMGAAVIYMLRRRGTAGIGVYLGAKSPKADSEVDPQDKANESHELGCHVKTAGELPGSDHYLYQLHSDSKPSINSTPVPVPVVYELAGSEGLRPELDGQSTITSRSREDEGSLASPLS